MVNFFFLDSWFCLLQSNHDSSSSATPVGTQKGPFTLPEAFGQSRYIPEELTRRKGQEGGKKLGGGGGQELEEWEKAWSLQRRRRREKGGRGPRRPCAFKGTFSGGSNHSAPSLKASLHACGSWSGFIDKNRYCFRVECVNESHPGPLALTWGHRPLLTSLLPLKVQAGSPVLGGVRGLPPNPEEWLDSSCCPEPMA